MKTLLNVIWLLFSGIWMALAYAVAGLICCVLIVTIPFGVACFRIAGYALWPFGNTVVQRRDAGIASGVGNVIWLIVAGIWLALGHILAGIGFFVTIVGIPFGMRTRVGEWCGGRRVPRYAAEAAPHGLAVRQSLPWSELCGAVPRYRLRPSH